VYESKLEILVSWSFCGAKFQSTRRQQTARSNSLSQSAA
jgi:hypothetical protein